MDSEVNVLLMRHEPPICETLVYNKHPAFHFGLDQF